MKKLLFLSMLTVLFVSAIGQSPKKIIQLPVETAINDSDLIFIGHPADGRLQQAEISKLFDAIGNVDFTGTLDIYKRDDSVFYLIDTVEHFAFIDSASDLQTTDVLSIYKRGDSVFYNFNSVESFAFIDSVGNTTPGYILDQYAIQQTARAWFDSVRIAKATVLKNGLNSSTTTTGFLLVNETPATNIQVQAPPRLELRGYGWNSTAGASQPYSVYLSALPQSSTGAPLGLVTLSTSWSTLLSYQDGVQPANTLVTFPGSVTVGSVGILSTQHLYGTATTLGGTQVFDINNADHFFGTSGNLQLTFLGHGKTDNGYRFQSYGEFYGVGGGAIVGLSDPSGLTATANGTLGGIEYKYKIVASTIDGHESGASNEATVSNLTTTLSGSSRAFLQWTHVDGAYQYKVYRTTAGGTGNSGTTGLIATVNQANNPQYFDQGNAGDLSTPGGINTTGNLGVGTTTPQGVLDVQSTAQGSLPFPRMTKAERDALTGVVNGTFVFVTDNGGYLSWYNSGWFKVTSSAD